MRKELSNSSPLIIVLLLATALILISYSTHKKSSSVEGMVYVQAGKINSSLNDELKLNDFLLDKNLVTVAEFDEFVRATNYKTEAETFGDAAVFDPNQQAWVLVSGANYKFPFGKEKKAAELNHPVTQVSWNDALAFAKWKGKRLPTRAEWEFAAHNKENTNAPYAWGDQLVVNGKYKANTWQGSFPFHNTVDDGYEFTSPVGAYGENESGFTDMGGNVWQWCNDSIEPAPQDKIFDPSPRRVIIGGSYLCEASVCHGYQIEGYSLSTPESSMAHIGFRCAKDVVEH
jgi:formylglycine-generating enzyme